MRSKEKFPLVSMIIVNYNGKNYLKELFNSIYNLNYPKNKIEIIFVDNCSADGSVEFVKKNFPKVKVILNDVNNYSRANNLGIQSAKGEFIAFLNTDIVLDKDWLKELIKLMQINKKIGAVGGKIFFKDRKTLQSTGHQPYPNFYWGDRGFQEEDRSQYDKIEEVPSLCGASVLYRKSCLEDIGLFDEDFIMYFEDVEMSERCRKKGWKLFYVPLAKVYHQYLGSGGQKLQDYYVERNRLLFIAKHYPERLPEALFGKGYFVVENKKDFFIVLDEVISKLIRHHSKELFIKILPDLMESLKKIDNFDKDYLAKKNYQLTNQLTQRETQLNQLNQKLTDLIQELTNRNNEINQLQQQTIELSNRLKEKDELLAEKEQTINQLQQKLTDLNQQLNNRTEQLNQFQQQVLDLSSKLKEKDSFLTEKDATINQLNQKLTDLIQELTNRNNEINQLQQQTIELSNRLTEKENTIIKIQKELNDIYNSTGFKYLLNPLWKILWPIKQFFKRIFFLKIFLEDVINYFLKKYFLLTARLWRNQYFNYLKNKKNPPFPEKLTIMLTRRCNLNCEFCDQSYKFNQEMSLDDAMKVIDSAKNLNIKTLVITGGEPFLHPDLFKIIRYAKENGFSVCITTNGTLIKSKVNDILSSNIDFLTISLDGIKEIHDILRGFDGTFNRVIEGIEELEKNGYKNFSICFVVTNKNIKELEKVYSFCKAKNISFDFWPVNGAPHLYLKEKKDIDLFLRFIKKLRKKGEISKEKYLYLIKSIDYFNQKKFNVRCLGLVKEICVDVDNKIFPCCLFGKRKNTPDLGSILYNNIYELWNSQQYYELRKKIYFDGCNGDCYNIALQEFSSITGLPFYIPYKISPPTRVLINVTIRCNLSCKHCDNWKMKNYKELTTQQWKKIILYLKKWLGNFELIIGGGEPLIREDIIELIGLCAKNKLHTVLDTNGYIIDRKLAKQIVDSGLSVLNISLDGIKAETHDYTRGKKGVYQKIIEAIEYLNYFRKDKHMNLTLSTIIMNTNIDEIPLLYDFVIEKGIDGIYFLPLFPNFNSKFDNEWYKKSELWPKDLKKLFNLIDWLINQKIKKDNLRHPIIINSIEHLKLIKKYYENPEKKINAVCITGRKMFSITEDGNILLCPFFEPIGNILKNDLDYLWRSKQAEEMRTRINNCERNCKILGCFSDV